MNQRGPNTAKFWRRRCRRCRRRHRRRRRRRENELNIFYRIDRFHSVDIMVGCDSGLRVRKCVCVCEPVSAGEQVQVRVCKPASACVYVSESVLTGKCVRGWKGEELTLYLE